MGLIKIFVSNDVPTRADGYLHAGAAQLLLGAPGGPKSRPEDRRAPVESASRQFEAAAACGGTYERA